MEKGMQTVEEVEVAVDHEVDDGEMTAVSGDEVGDSVLSGESDSDTSSTPGQTAEATIGQPVEGAVLSETKALRTGVAPGLRSGLSG